MKIVIATPFYPPEKGVLGTYAAGIGAALRKEGHEVVDVVFSRFHHLPAGVRHFAYFWLLLRVAHGAAFVLAFDTWSVGMPAYFAAKLRGVPLRLRIGGDFLWETYVERTKEPVCFSEFYAKDPTLTLKEKTIRAFTHMLLHGAQVLFFNSRFQRDIWQSAYGFSKEKACILENTYPEKRPSEPGTNRVFVSAGRPIALKNNVVLERVFTRIKERYPKVELDQRFLPPEEHRHRVADCYAVIVPSISEMSSNTAMDAVAAGKPFIMTDDTGTKERLGECGIFVDTRSEETFIAAIERMLNPDEYAYFLARIREFSLTRTWDDLAREILSAL